MSSGSRHVRRRDGVGCAVGVPRRDGRPCHPEALRFGAVDRPQRDEVHPAGPRVCRGGRLRGPALRRKAARAADGYEGEEVRRARRRAAAVGGAFGIVRARPRLRAMREQGPQPREPGRRRGRADGDASRGAGRGLPDDRELH